MTMPDERYRSLIQVKRLLLDLIKHDRNTDIAFQIIERDESSDTIKLKGYWLNIVNPNNIYMIDFDSIIITRDQLPNWKVIS